MTIPFTRTFLLYSSCLFLACHQTCALLARSVQSVPLSPDIALPPSNIFEPAFAALSRQDVAQAGQALTGDFCDIETHCLAPRRCLDMPVGEDNIVKPCSSSSASCLCVNVRMCVSDIECDEGESCALAYGYPLCVSKRRIQLMGYPPVPSPSADASPPLFGFTGDFCSTDADCRGGRKCRPNGQPLSERPVCGPMFMSCSCISGNALMKCENPVDAEDWEGEANDAESECPDGEVCQTLEGYPVCFTAKVSLAKNREAKDESPPLMQGLVGNTVGDDTTEETAAENAEENEQDNEEDIVEENVVCIAMQSLGKFKQDELLFSTPRLARVLCDANESCATPGHMVSYNKKLMMMKTYCELRGCTSKLTYVNSPRFRHAMRIESNTDSLSFTALAARFETRTEERLLSLAVRVGLL